MATLTRVEVARRILTLPPDRQVRAMAAFDVLYGDDESGPNQADRAKELHEAYAFDAHAYIREQLGWNPWRGRNGQPGQVEIIEAYTLALRQQYERLAYEAGDVALEELRWWDPDQPIRYIIRVEAGHTVGKTKLASGMASHFFDCFVPGVIYTLAPTWDQIKDLLWKEIATDREGKDARGTGDLLGRVLETCEIKHLPNHFAKGRAPNNTHGRGTERIHGQHERHLLFVFDEAEGVPDFAYDAVDSMTSGGVVIVLLIANPKTRTSRFYKVRVRPEVVNFRLSCVHHPNVIENREVVPGAVRRQYVESMASAHCEVVGAHDVDAHTFDLPFPVRTKDGLRPAGTIFQPDAEFMFRVLGVAPKNLADNTFVPVGRYEAALARTPRPQQPHRARIGVDVARYGKDVGTVYVNHNGAVRRAARLVKLDTNAYAREVKRVALELAEMGVTDLQIRIDAGGGYGGGVADKLKIDLELMRAFKVFEVIEVHNNGVPSDEDAFADQVTEMYAHAGESLKGLAVIDPPGTLEQDLCERTYKWVNLRGTDVKKLTDKERFKKDFERSPDDGDGFVLAVTPDFVFDRPELERIPSQSYMTM